MSIYKLLIYSQHRLYNKLEVPFLHTQLLRDCHEIEYLVKRGGPPDREVILQQECEDEGVFRVEVLRGEDALGEFEQELDEDRVEGKSLLEGFRVVELFVGEQL